MATVKVKFRASSVGEREGTLFFQVIHGRRARQVNTGLRLFPSEWDGGRSEVVVIATSDEKRRGYLLALRESVRAERARLMEVITHADRAGLAYTADDIVERYLNAEKEGGFLAFARRHVVHLGKTGRRSAVDKLRAALGSFVRFHGEKDVPFSGFDGDLMEEYEGWLKERGVCMNTVSFYMRTLRTVYNLAVERGLAERRNPFKYVYTGIDKTVKRAVPLKVIKRIRELDLTLSPQKDFARDVFLFSFYTRGMSFVDMAYLKKKDLQNGVLSYRRHKTNQRLSIKWEKPMQEIIAKYDTGGSPYLLPIIRDMEKDARRQYQNALHTVNRRLKEIGEDIGLSIPLTTYVARHGWASIAHSRNIPTATISEALGHDSEKTTRIYLASLDTSAVDKANSQILRAL